MALLRAGKTAILLMKKGKTMSVTWTVRILSLLPVFAVGLWLFTATVSAETYNVNASVPYDAPTQLAVIDSPDDGATFNDVQQTISGTCQVQNPTTVVSIWRNGSAIGSASCQGGSFSVTVILSIGQNTLIARTANVSNIYGPDSQPKTFTVTTPIPAKSLPPSVNQPASAEDRTAATNQGELSGLSLEVEAPFSLLSDSKVAIIRIVVQGGQQPYVLNVKWGDGSTESHTLADPGTYEYSHTYEVDKTYTVYAYVRDAVGSYTEYMYAVVSGNKVTSEPTEKSASGGSLRSDSGPWSYMGIAWYYWLVIAFIIVFLLSSYWLGYRLGRDRSEAEAKQQAEAGKKKRNKKK